MKYPAFSRMIPILVMMALLSIGSSGCGSPSASQSGLAMASMEGMPAEVQSAPIVVQQAYQFAAANPEVLKKIPCYCGCDDLGHTSNYACYVSGVDDSGKITYDSHALGCSICVDITQDVMRQLKQGQPVSKIKAYIDQTYAQYGPSNMP
ncbi:MAG: hypothetical protein C3F13_04300 [Anaerolineales bacterium]|nr:hypothetical protein [Anaerolineae bacterium]PWB55508.1 MAG: hypothetical protein C3F13_04300 [Anaerolineales bacterium]